MLGKKSPLIMLSALSIALGSVTAYAANTTALPDDSLRLSIPKLKPGFEFNVASLWLQPAASNLNYVILNKALPAQSPSWIEQELNPAYTAAFEVGLRYVFPNSGQDVKLAWTHLNSATSSTTNADGVGYFLGPDYEIGPTGIPIQHATGDVDFRYDVVNLDVGQYMSFGQHLDMRFFGGLSTGFLRENVKASYSGNRVATYPGPFVMDQDVYSNFSGVGPRIGLHADYNACYGFGFLGETAVTALFGSMYSKTSFIGGSQELAAKFGQSTNAQIIEDQRVYQVIPGLDAKLGVSYKHAFGNDALFTVSTGYQAAVYFNAISQYLPGTLVAGEGVESGGIFVATMNHTLSNYSVKGPFLNFALEI